MRPHHVCRAGRLLSIRISKQSRSNLKSLNCFKYRERWFLPVSGLFFSGWVLRRETNLDEFHGPDLIWRDKNGVAHPIMSNETVARVFRRLADRMQGVVADTSMMTISPEYAAHFLEVYVKKTENAKFTGDRVRFLMLTLPFVVRDLIAPEVCRYT